MVAKSRMRTVSSVSVWRSGYHVHELLRANWGGTLKERDRNRLFSLGVIAASSPKPLASRSFMQILLESLPLPFNGSDSGLDRGGRRAEP